MNNGETVHSIDNSHRLQLFESHKTLLKSASYIAFPIITVIIAIINIADPCWQNLVLACGFLTMGASWFFALGLARRQHSEKSATLFIASIIGYETLTMLFMNSTPASSLLACTIMIIYASLFSRRALLFSTAGTSAGFVAGEFVRWLTPFQPRSYDGWQAFILEVGLVLFLLPLAAQVLRRSHAMKDSLVEKMTAMNVDQEKIIETAKDVVFTLDEVIGRLEEFSMSLASQAAEQATAIAQTGVVMDQIRRIAGETAESAAATRVVAETTKEKSELTNRQLKSVEEGFGNVVASTESARTEFTELASQAESIENVLSVNRNIAAQIKILAINAGIQAAKVGELGTGFDVVARELKSMIQNTDKSLEDSRTLLEGIRKRARMSAETIRTSSELLRRHSEGLKETGSLLVEIAESFKDSSVRFRKISEAAVEQQTRLNEVTNGMTQLDISAADLNKQSNILVESVRKISESQASLRNILSASTAENRPSM